MKSFNNLAEWANKKNNKIATSHENKDVTALKKILVSVETEQQKIIKELRYVDYILSLIHSETGAKTKKEPEKFDDYWKYKSWMKELKKSLKEIHKKGKSSYTPDEVEFQRHSKIRLLKESKRLENHLRVVDAIIVKNKVLLMEIEEELSSDLSKGYSIASVAQIIKDEFGSKIEKGYTSGRNIIAKFLEKRFAINRKAALELLEILIDRKVMDYCIKIPREKSSENVYFNPSFIDDLMDIPDGTSGESNFYVEPLFGSWNIKA